jgi:histidinol-phosphate/aromatic aminotransferase/cobyric acid decarboxylase-like protein/choline kinase
MIAVILAAGSGQRMRPLTQSTHKTLLPVGTETVLARIILSLLELEIQEIAVVTGYRANDVRTHLETRFPDLPIHYIHNADYLKTNNLVSLHLALESIKIDSDLILIESDLVFDISVLRRLVSSPHPNVALVDRYAPGMDGTVVTIDGTVITGVIPPHLQGANFTFQDKFKTLNLYKFSRAFCAETFRNLLAFYATTHASQCYYELVLGIVIYLHSAQIHAEIVEGKTWAEIDDPNDLEIARYTFVPSCRAEVLDRSYGGYWNYRILDFRYLRNVFFPSPSVISELKNSFETVIGHYGSAQEILDTKMSYFQLCRPERIIALNGLSQIYPWLAEWYRGRCSLVPSPTYGEYARAFPNALSYADGEDGFNLDEIEGKLAEAELICFVNPNNPTGSLLPSSWIYQLASRYPSKTFLVDESFLDFSLESSLVEKLEESPLENLVVLKSLSKSLGVPGLRLGWIYCTNPSFLKKVHSVLPVWNLNAVAENFLEIILKHRSEIEASFQLIRDERDALRTQLAGLSFVEKTYESHANFLLARFRCPPERLDTRLRLLLSERAIYLKGCQEKFGGGAALARLAVRRAEENQHLISGLRHVFQNHE